MPTVTKIGSLKRPPPQKKKVAAYARVSLESERLEHSLEAQIDYYTKLIQSNSDWEFAGVYSDDFISGTGTKKRIAFQNMLEDCELGKIDIILTKSISRFARNTVDLLQTVRHLKDLGIEVRFERENINSLSAEGELLLTILASFAQAESQSISENVKWTVYKKREKGKPFCHFHVFGYRWEGDSLVPEPEEAELVRIIFQDFLDGKSITTMATELNEAGIKTKKGGWWHDSSLRTILQNEIYTGDLLLAKRYTPDPLFGRDIKNQGEVPQVLVENDHPAIIDKATFESVQRIFNKGKKTGPLVDTHPHYFFAGKIKCPVCGSNYTHFMHYKGSHVYERWRCAKSRIPGQKCPIGGSVRQDRVEEALAKVLGLEAFDENVINREVKEIYVPKRNTIEIHLTNGDVVQAEIRRG